MRYLSEIYHTEKNCNEIEVSINEITAEGI
jgi:hypothetical protein